MATPAGWTLSAGSRRSTEDTFDSAIYQQHPQLSKTLRTEFSALLVGYRDALGRLRRHLPSQPPPLHYSVLPCDLPTLTAFSEQMTYFRLLLAAGRVANRTAPGRAHSPDVHPARERLPWLARAAREVSTLLQAESARLLTVLYDIEP
ncbi:MAG: hypothetical protein IPO15_17075 [Anaerolineae bacterium]|uniref:hypothetical protein n=1 Tax=Candidatus Amarolinea dominans TaxID=3140696 RepID=UPI00313750E5|nr:hypothetical protein [Anaerolineae bacterium]